MFKIIIVIILIIILIIFYNYFYNSKEKFINNQFSTQFSGSNYKSNMNKSIYPNDPSNQNNQVMFNTFNYNNNLSDDNADLTYYQNDTINQSNINEDATDIIYSIDKIDYGDVTTGLDKCNKDCPGVCFEMGYTGTATCYPKITKPFDWGTLYKNPTFTYGYNAFGPDNLKK